MCVRSQKMPMNQTTVYLPPSQPATNNSSNKTTTTTSMMMNYHGVLTNKNVVCGIEDKMKTSLRTRIRQENLHSYYEVDGELGRGKFAVVRKCVCRQTGKTFAAKFTRRRRKGEDCRGDIVREIEILEALDHSRLIKLHEVFETKNDVILILEFAGGGEIFRYLSGDMEECFTEQDVIRFLIQILEAVKHLHDLDIVHLDIKPQNILLTERNLATADIKLVDFGLARLVTKGEEIRDIVGTPDYVSPEVLNYEPIAKPADMWSIGVLAYVMLTGFSPFAGDDKQQTFLNISTVNIDFPEEWFDDFSPLAEDFISALLVKESSDRLTVDQCMAHSWLQENSARSSPHDSLPVVNSDTMSSLSSTNTLTITSNSSLESPSDSETLALSITLNSTDQNMDSEITPTGQNENSADADSSVTIVNVLENEDRNGATRPPKFPSVTLGKNLNSVTLSSCQSSDNFDTLNCTTIHVSHKLTSDPVTTTTNTRPLPRRYERRGSINLPIRPSRYILDKFGPDLINSRLAASVDGRRCLSPVRKLSADGTIAPKKVKLEDSLTLQPTQAAPIC